MLQCKWETLSNWFWSDPTNGCLHSPRRTKGERLNYGDITSIPAILCWTYTPERIITLNRLIMTIDKNTYCWNIWCYKYTKELYLNKKKTKFMCPVTGARQLAYKCDRWRILWAKEWITMYTFVLASQINTQRSKISHITLPKHWMANFRCSEVGQTQGAFYKKIDIWA